jgi:hypothetical protein
VLIGGRVGKGFGIGFLKKRKPETIGARVYIGIEAIKTDSDVASDVSISMYSAARLT